MTTQITMKATIDSETHIYIASMIKHNSTSNSNVSSRIGLVCAKKSAIGSIAFSDILNISAVITTSNKYRTKNRKDRFLYCFCTIKLVTRFPTIPKLKKICNPHKEAIKSSSIFSVVNNYPHPFVFCFLSASPAFSCYHHSFLLSNESSESSNESYES